MGSSWYQNLRAKHIVLILKYEQQLVLQQGVVLDQGHQAFGYPPNIKIKIMKQASRKRAENIKFH